MTSAEIFRETLKPNGKPERQLKQYEAITFIGTPISRYLNGNRKRGSTSKDRWGVTISFPEDAPGPMPHITDETKVCPDVTHWRDYVHAPDLMANCQDGWEECLAQAEQIRANGKLVGIVMGTGMFEECHYLMGFEDTLTGLYEHPQEMHELIDYIFEYRLTYLKLLIDKLHPDVILSHDDWGAKESLFMNADTWREFYKEPYRGFYGYMRAKGVLAVHHADSYCAPIVPDMIEIGIQAWQGVLPENDIPALLQETDGKITLMGGIGAAIDRADAQEDEIRAYVRGVLEENCSYGHFIPCITYGAPGTVFKHVDPFIDDEIDKYNSVLHAPNFGRPEYRRIKTTVKKAKVVTEVHVENADTSILSNIAQSLKKGQKARVLKQCQTALDQGFERQDILKNGLVVGMNQLGDDFSANRAFVPEMLLAARCMSAATELLKPYLISGDNAAVGKVCIGTVKGDMHDIGKNLVKIMMEGSGITVVDLGVDVTAEKFVQTAIDEKCDIICCSALLTTTMSEMRKVVELTKEAGIRDKVKIMVGGAPITQEYCDEIGADIYTDDAGRAAKAAVAALAGM